MKVMVKRFRVDLYYASSEAGEDDPLETKEGAGQIPDAISVDGFSCMQIIDLRQGWQEMMKHRMTRYEADCQTCETFVKFGEVMQWKKDYRLVFEVVY